MMHGMMMRSSRRALTTTAMSSRQCAAATATATCRSLMTTSSASSRDVTNGKATREGDRRERDGARTPAFARGFAGSSASADAADDDMEAKNAKDDDVVVDLDKKMGAKTTPKVQAIVDQVCALTLIEINELCDSLAARLGLGDMSGMMFGGGGGMMMGGGGGAMAGGGGGGGAAEPAAAAAPAKTEFTVKLESFDAAQKIKVIKEVRAITELGLKEAKELVEGTPAVLKKDMKKEDAEAIVEKLKAVGAVVVLE
uniref:Large ribosomal subunit protein bL12 C-terminal domain-containing protein n=1 Tax=Ostreococcus mediterraneus TaxID=1486918 RepID=A0A6T5YMS8_9CHLO|mmetsp:Transcript_4437/g.16246  ORF Transcript_4437/g.16246 Transcript_4437/m.16246 type:complete len:255 (+) Transcript_4437:165-929(+)